MQTNFEKWEKENEEQLLEEYKMDISTIEQAEYDSSIELNYKDLQGYWNWAKNRHACEMENYIYDLEQYLGYVTEYPDMHEIKGNYPVCFKEWLDNENKE